MKHIKSFLIFEKSIGSEAIRNRYYSDISKDLYYKIVNIDPTSIRKKDFSKPGKFTKWLLIQYKKKNLTNEMLFDEEYINRLNYYLFIASTGWFKFREKPEYYIRGGQKHFLHGGFDILKFNIDKLTNKMSFLTKEYEESTEKSKYDYVYSDDKVDILVPLNFAASYETAKNTQWCSKQFSGYSIWSDRAILFRIMSKDKNIVKLTWVRKNKGSEEWYIAGPKYPEIRGDGTPFDIVHNMEKWKYKISGPYEYNQGSNQTMQDAYPEQCDSILKVMNLLSDKAKNYIIDYKKKNEIHKGI